MSEKIIKAVNEYFEFFNNQDAEGIAQLYADNAKVTDPVGTPTKIGKEAILSFYKLAVKNGARLKRSGPIRVSQNFAAFAFTVSVGSMTSVDKDVAVEVELPKGSMIIDVIDTFKFNEEGQITEMNAYWGPSNITQV
ncbi:MAG: nuclear transport factor 2 family protein [Hellea sp.]|jgi:steroid delta-isomerase